MISYVIVEAVPEFPYPNNQTVLLVSRLYPVFEPLAPIDSAHWIAFELNLTQQVSDRETAPLIPVLFAENMLPAPEKTYAAVAPDPENVALDNEKVEPALKPITVLPDPEYDLVFAASTANTTESNDKFFGPL